MQSGVLNFPMEDNGSSAGDHRKFLAKTDQLMVLLMDLNIRSLNTGSDEFTNDND